MMSDLAPIPIPAEQRWQNFRMQALPVLVFCILIGVLFFLWSSEVNPPAFRGMVEAKQIEVSSPSSGSLTQLSVQRFQRVVAGEPLAKIITTDPKIIEAQLAVISAEVNLLQARLEADINRNAVDYEQLRLDWMQQKVSLATSRVNLQLAENELTRIRRLMPSGVASEQELDVAQTTRDSLRVEVEEKQKLIAQTEAALQRIESELGQGEAESRRDPLLAAIEVQSQRIRLTEAEMSPITLKAPIEGMVSVVHRHSGENLSAGDPILVISSSESVGIVGYVPQPFPFEPAEEMEILVRTTTVPRQEAKATILRVGVQLEEIPAGLRIPGSPSILGLPVFISLPTQLSVMPREHLELIKL